MPDIGLELIIAVPIIFIGIVFIVDIIRGIKFESKKRHMRERKQCCANCANRIVEDRCKSPLLNQSRWDPVFGPVFVGGPYCEDTVCTKHCNWKAIE